MHHPLPAPTILGCSLLVLYFLPMHAGAQFSDSLTVLKSEWIENMTDRMSYKLAVTNDLEAFTVSAQNFNPELFPNTATTFKLSVNHKFLSFSLKHAPDFIPGNHDDKQKGRTKNLGLSFGFVHPHWFASISYSRHKGYYINNSDEISDAWQSGDPYLQLPDMRVNSFEGSMGYSFNEHFSVRALTTQTERQIKSAGTFAPVFGYRLYFVNNLTEFSGQKTANVEFIVGAGYQYTFVTKKQFYASLGLTPGFGYIFTKLTTRGQLGSPDDIITDSTSPIMRVDGRCALGYSGDKLFAGALLDLRTSSYKQERTTVVNTDSHVFYQIFVGIRTSAPKKLDQSLNKLPLK